VLASLPGEQEGHAGRSCGFTATAGRGELTPKLRDGAAQDCSADRKMSPTRGGDRCQGWQLHVVCVAEALVPGRGEAGEPVLVGCRQRQEQRLRPTGVRLFGRRGHGGLADDRGGVGAGVTESGGPRLTWRLTGWPG